MGDKVDNKINEMVELYKQGNFTEFTHTYFVGHPILTLAPIYKRLVGNDPDKNMTQVEVCHGILDEIKKLASK